MCAYAHAIHGHVHVSDCDLVVRDGVSEDRNCVTSSKNVNGILAHERIRVAQADERKTQAIVGFGDAAYSDQREYR